MIEITTDKHKNRKTALVDGYTYVVRQPGAGESLMLSQLGREITAMGKKSKLSKSDEQALEDMTAKAIGICLSLFDARGDQKARDYLDTLDVDILMETISQIYGKAEVDEPAKAEAAPANA